MSNTTGYVYRGEVYESLYIQINRRLVAKEKLSSGKRSFKEEKYIK